VRVTEGRLVRVLAFVVDYTRAHGTVVSSQVACDACVQLVEASGAGLTLMNGAGRGDSRYATNEAAAAIDESQFTLGEGPSLDAFRSDLPVLVPDLDTARNHDRWPMFTPAAVRTGARALFVFPLRTGAVRLGTLVLHRTTPGPLTVGQISDALVITDVILSLLLDELAPTQPDPAQRLSEGVRLSRAEIHQATGMVSVQLGVTIEEALLRLRAYAFANDLLIADVARDVVSRRLRLEPPLTPDAL
jgi:GAF domain-containing protein